MSRHPDEIVRRALERAQAAIEDLYAFLGADVTVEDLRQAWSHWLQGETAGRSESEERLSPAGRVASELIMATMSEAAERGVVHSSRVPDGEPEMVGLSAGAGAELLEESEFYRASVVAVRDELVAARAEVARLEPLLARAQVRFGNAIRRWHQAGAPVARIAGALGMSEEAVARVVGSLSSRGYTPVLACSFCAASGHLIAGPSVYICSECVEAAQRVGDGDAASTSKAMQLQPAGKDDPCNFCGKSRRMVRFLVEGVGVRICDECLDLCAEILAEQFEV